MFRTAALSVQPNSLRQMPVSAVVVMASQPPTTSALPRQNRTLEPSAYRPEAAKVVSSLFSPGGSSKTTRGMDQLQSERGG